MEASISRWHKTEGNSVKVGELLVELKWGRVRIDVPSEETGILTEIKYKEYNGSKKLDSKMV